jgi:glycosyltransferase involved in cell wall biosynthesis
MSARGLTIAIPNWNHELLLPRSLRSALAAVQELRTRGVAAEVLVIDDESRDGSRLLLRQLEGLLHGASLRVLALKQNVGLGPARNIALQQARYRHVAFMDADNELLSANTHSFYQSALETGAAAVYGKLLIRPVTGTTSVGVLSGDSVDPTMFASNHIDAFALVDRIQFLDLGGYSSMVPGWEDYEQWLHLLTNGRKLVFVPLVFGFYYLLPNSMITAFTDDQKTRNAQNRMGRAYNQLQARHRLPLASLGLRYLPSIGYF